MAGGMGGSETTEQSIPGWLEGPTKEMLQRSVDSGKTGYMPYYGPEVAGFDPMQMAAIGNMNQAASAFGMNTAQPAVGTGDLSSIELYNQAMDQFAAERPGQKSYYDSFFVDPFSGNYGANMATPQSGGLGGGPDPLAYDYNDMRYSPILSNSLLGELGGMGGDVRVADGLLGSLLMQPDRQLMNERNASAREQQFSDWAKKQGLL